MPDFLRYVLYELRNSLVLVLLAGIFASVILAAAYFIHKKKYKGREKFPWGKVFLWLIFLAYLIVVIYATMLRGAGLFHREWNFHLFRAWAEAWNNFSVKSWANVLLNVAMFVPLGFLLPLLGKKFRKWYIVIPAGFCASLVIELLQLAIGRGICDVDDLFCNTLGAVIGYFLIMTILSIFTEKRLKSALIYGCLSLAPILAICGIFIVYQVREYGNLPNAAAYSTNVNDLEWNMECALPDYGGQAATYRNQPRSIEECDIFAAEFAELAGTTFDDISYYQEAAYYMNHGDENGYHFLFVHYHDSGYTYTWGSFDDPVWVEADRQTLEAALEGYPLILPEYAVFTVEGDGWHSFSVDAHVDGSAMIDGTVRCRYAQDGTVREIENDLLSYTYYDCVDIISAEEAYRQLRGGNFSGADTIKYYADHTVSVVSCSLDYEIDTKGFYQPVYIFGVVIPENGFEYRIMIPAMK